MIPENDTADNGDQKIRSRSWIFLFGIFLIALILVVYYFGEIQNEFKLLGKVSLAWLAAAIASQFLTYYSNALIYHALLTSNETTDSPARKDLLKASLITVLFNQTVPSAGISGNTFLFHFLSRFRISRDRTIALILQELLIFYAAILTLIVFLLMASLFPGKSFLAFKTTLIAGFMVYSAFTIFIIFAGKRHWIERLLQISVSYPLVKKILHIAETDLFHETVQHAVRRTQLWQKVKRKIIVKAFLFQLLGIASDVFTVFVLFPGTGYSVPFLIVLFAFVSTKIITLIPSLPGSLILYESSLSFYLAKGGVPIGLAIIVTLLYRLLSFWLPMPIGTYFYRRWLASRSA